MKCDIIKLDGDSSNKEKALDHVEESAISFGFDDRDAAFSRLLAEEGISAFSSVIGANEVSVWVETKEKDFEIHLKGDAAISCEDREELISLSKNKANTPKKGILGKIASLIDYIASDRTMGEDPFYIYSMYPEIGAHSIDMICPDMISWSMQKEQKKKEKKCGITDIEKSIIERFADDIIVSIALKDIELIIKKTKK